MKYRDPLKQILAQTRSHWDCSQIRPEVRDSFRKALECRTPALGAEVYASETEERIVYHTCKSRACPSCGHRATIQWQRERWAALPDVPYKGITFTMPRELWALFRDNRTLAAALPSIAAGVIEAWARARHGVRVGVMAILHTFNGRLEFNSHVHTMVSAGGLRASSCTWISSIFYDNNRLMMFWRAAVGRLLQQSLRMGVLKSKMTLVGAEVMLREQCSRWWSVKVQTFKSREHFLRYAGRYVRRPPIAQRRITHIGESSIGFWVKDKKLRRRGEVDCSPEQFIDRWAEHIPRRYQHSMRHVGLLAPRAVGQASAGVFAILGQIGRHRPRPRRWADSLTRDFGWDPLLDNRGHRMRWRLRLSPQNARDNQPPLSKIE